MCTKTAERFLLTALVVDDKAYIPDSISSTPSSIQTPDRRTQAEVSEEISDTMETSIHSLDAQALINSFAEYGIICAVMAPRENDRSAANTITSAAKCADMVIFDWKFYDDDGEKAFEFLTKLLEGDEAGRLRLITIYTGENDLRRIGETLQQKLVEHEMNFELCNEGVELFL